MSHLVRKNYSALGEVKAPYVHSVKHGNTLYISGLTAFGTTAQHEGIVEQAEEIFSQIRKIASAEETDFSALIKVTIFITSFEEIDGLRNVLYRNYGDHLPASSLVEVSRLFSPDLSIEIEAIFGL
ncbi:RidA family protein [Erwinia persicina]|uniref:Enamine deaminase RidA n=1 Tax=Erwinia persicina TaxID=55211 RepID=A0A4U3FNK5_9GAMM|nr:RidA family protein [Erwinia persicina]MBD8105453.1 RidA family protein [Erwinia persicina]MBD8208599.1 RidA family protein [Erwinia persicina]QZQ48686.1 RidA family protein [Erwinia persicina]TKJ94862.1 enamine deaminase RidA [Erwinia persicina]HBH64776.1 enamine deaminase RidA [Erwinia persicina]